MALEFICVEGFEWASNLTDLREKYSIYEANGSGTAYSIDTVTYKTGTRSLNSTNTTNYGDFEFPLKPESVNGVRSIHAGCHLRVSNVGTLWTGVFYNTFAWDVSQQGYITFNASGFPICTRGTTTVATGSVAITANQWHWFEWYHAIDNTNGRWIVKIDGTNCVDFTGDTQNDATYTGCLYCRLQGPRITGYEMWLDNLFVRTSESVESDPTFYGPCYVQSILPDADGNYSQWSSTASPTQYTEIDDAQVGTTSPTTHINSSTNSQKSSFSHAAVNLTNPGDDVVLCVALDHHAKKDTAGGGTARQFTRISSTDYNGTEQGLPYNTWERVTSFWEDSPATASAWSATEIDNAEFGIEFLS